MDKQIDLIKDLRDQLITAQQHKEDHNRIIDKLDELIVSITAQTVVLERNAIVNDEAHDVIKKTLAYIKQLVDTIMEFVGAIHGFQATVGYIKKAALWGAIMYVVYLAVAGNLVANIINS